MANDPVVSQMVANLNPMNDFIRAQQFASGILSAAEERQVAAQTGVLRSQQLLGQMQDNQRTFDLRKKEFEANQSVSELNLAINQFKFDALKQAATDETAAWKGLASVKNASEFDKWYLEHAKIANAQQINFAERKGWISPASGTRKGTVMSADELAIYKAENPTLEDVTTVPLSGGNFWVGPGKQDFSPKPNLKQDASLIEAQGIVDAYDQSLAELESIADPDTKLRERKNLNDQYRKAQAILQASGKPVAPNPKPGVPSALDEVNSVFDSLVNPGKGLR